MQLSPLLLQTNDPFRGVSALTARHCPATGSKEKQLTIRCGSAILYVCTHLGTSNAQTLYTGFTSERHTTVYSLQGILFGVVLSVPNPQLLLQAWKFAYPSMFVQMPYE